jgi:putative flippase GtrA
VKPLASDLLADTYRKPLRFLLVGGSFALGYSLVMALLVGPVGLPAFATSVVLYVLCIPAAFLAQRKLTFARQEARRGGFLVYAGMQVASLALVASVTTRFVTQVFVVDTLLFLATAGAAALLSYFVSDRLAFRPEV